MASLSSWLRFYCLLKLVAEFNGYVLLAADAEDFRNIAKKIVPGTLANKLAVLASDMSVKQNTRDNSEQPEYYYDSESEEEEEIDGDVEVTTEHIARDPERSEEDIYVKEWKTRVNFDELVERVKDRLAKELSVKLKKHIFNPRNKNRTQNIYNHFEQKEIQDILNKPAVYDDNYGDPYNHNTKTVKTYGYNISKNKRKPNENHENTNRYNEAASQNLDHKISQAKIIEKEREIDQNNKYIHYGKSAKDNYEKRVTKNYDYSDYIAGNAKQNKYVSKEKQSNEMNHEEDNNMFHSHNKLVAYSIEETPKKMTNTVFDTKDMNNHEDSVKFSQNQHEENESIRHDKNLPKQFNKGPNAFVGTNNNKELYDEFDLLSKRRNDSYEDYVIPKVENKYASDETSTPNYHERFRKEKPVNNKENSRFKVQYNSNFQGTTKNDWDYTENSVKVNEDYTEVTEKSQEIKAKTESLWYNYDVGSKGIKDDRDIDKENTSATAVTQKSKAKGTMIPTREYFKMSSPNYYISLPTVVEKYDSNEPLPEKDRERQIIKHFVNPPASINKKVRLI